MLQIKKEIANIWEYKVGNNANIANFVHLRKTRMEHSLRVKCSGIENIISIGEKPQFSRQQ